MIIFPGLNATIAEQKQINIYAKAPLLKYGIKGDRMTIYILDNDSAECAKKLADIDLNNMIKALAKTLCNVHYELQITGKSETKKIPLNMSVAVPAYIEEFTRWTLICKANYLYLVELLDSLFRECDFRFNEHNKKYAKIAYWARDNVPPDLPHVGKYQKSPFVTAYLIDGSQTPFPLVMPKKYILSETDGELWFPDIINSYRNYYKAMLQYHIARCAGCNAEKTRGIKEPYCSIAKWTNRETPQWLKDLV